MSALDNRSESIPGCMYIPLNVVHVDAALHPSDKHENNFLPCLPTRANALSYVVIAFENLLHVYAPAAQYKCVHGPLACTTVVLHVAR
jgi:hypothetical protein